MKVFFQVICIVITFSSSPLLAQEDSTATDSSSALQARHVGVKNFYKIGSKENPVVANEYCAFLNSESVAKKQNDATAHFFLDNSFMNCTYACSNGASGSYHYPVKENDCITRLNEYTCRYVVIAGRGNYIIDGITKWYGYEHNDSLVLRMFNTWRKNPKAQDMCDYLNDKIEGRDGDAEAIENGYPQDIDRVEIFKWLDVVASTAHNDQELCLQLKIGDEENRPLIIFSMESDDISFHEGPIQAVLIPGMEYYRPVAMKLL